MNPSAILAAKDTARALEAQANESREALMLRLNQDANLADATKRLITALYSAVCDSKRTSESRDLPVTFLDRLQPLAESYGYTLSLSPTGSSVIITAN